MSVMEDIAVDPNFWVSNMINARISAAIADRKTQPGWITAAISFANTGGNPEDDEGVLSHGAATGVFKDAITRNAEIQDVDEVIA